MSNDIRCRCGHLHSEHHKITSHNYTAGRCIIGECRCAHFIHDAIVEKTNSPQEGSLQANYELPKEDDVIGDIKSQYIRATSDEQRNVKICFSQIVGNICLAYHRGLSVGQSYSPKGEEQAELMETLLDIAGKIKWHEDAEQFDEAQILKDNLFNQYTLIKKP